LNRERTAKVPKENIVADQSPSELLGNLQDSLKNNKKDSASLVKKISVLEARVADLSRATGEIDQKVSAYDKAQSGLAKQRIDSDDFFKAKQKVLEDSLPNRQSVIDIKKHGDDEVAAILKNLQQASDNVDKAQGELKGLQTMLEAKKADYAAKVDFGTSLSKDLKDLQDLQKLADQENDKNNFARMYFYILEMKDDLANINVPTAADYRKSLEAAAVSLSNATEDVRMKKDEVDNTMADMKKLQADYDTAKAKRRETTVAAIQEGLG
jgi:chromosome segregation ATPase